MGELVFIILATALGVIAAILHILPLAVRIARQGLLSALGILVHSAWLSALFFAGASLRVILLCFMASLFLYSVTAWVEYRRAQKEKDGKGGVTGDL